METLTKTPLYACHMGLQARMVDYAGWEMPVMYSGILDEARAVRQKAGIFDISHMGRVRISGDGATELLQRLTTNDVAVLNLSYAQYSLITNPRGGIIDDIIVYREAPDSYLVVVNASNSGKDLAWITQNNQGGTSIDDLTNQTAMIAVQGPSAPGIISRLARVHTNGLPAMSRFQFCIGSVVGVAVTFCRTGYTGEDGYELIVPAGGAAAVWTALMNERATPCGLGARDALRIEAGYPLYGHEIDESTTPVEAGLMWAVKLDKGAFVGHDRIAAIRKDGSPRRLVGLTLPDRIQPRQGYTIYCDRDEIGIVTSGVFSPTRGHSLAMGYVDQYYARTGTAVTIAIRDKRCAATVVPKKSLLES